MPLPPYILNSKEYLNWTPPYIPQIIAGGIMELQTRMIIFGDPKSWKSMLTLHTGFCLANGIDWFGFKTERCIVYKLQLELPMHIDHQRFIKYSSNLIVPNHRDPINFLHHTDNYMKLDSLHGYNKLAQDCERIREQYPSLPMVIILDPLYKMTIGHLADEYDMKKLFDNVDMLKDKFRASVIIIHHSRKTTLNEKSQVLDRGAEEASGTRFLSGWCDTMIKTTLLNPNGRKDKVKVSFSVTRNATDVLSNFSIHWSYKTLYPDFIESELPEDPEPTIRNLEDTEE